jgi:hypothetical protein
MNLLIFSRPGIKLYRELRHSETAWNALRFYDPIENAVGVMIPVSSLSAALSLASDLKYFIRKYGSEYLFETNSRVYCTPSVARSRYLEREPSVTPWPWKIWYIVRQDSNLEKYRTYSEVGDYDGEDISGGYIFEVHCSKEEYALVSYTDS